MHIEIVIFAYLCLASFMVFVSRIALMSHNCIYKKHCTNILLKFLQMLNFVLTFLLGLNNRNFCNLLNLMIFLCHIFLFMYMVIHNVLPQFILKCFVRLSSIQRITRRACDKEFFSHL